MKRHTPVFALIFAALLASCASLPPPATAEFEVRLATAQDFMSQGIAFNVNPYTDPPNLLSKNDKVIALYFKLGLPQKAQVHIEGSIEDSSGKHVGDLYETQELKGYWEFGATPGDSNIATKIEMIGRYSPPGLNFVGNAGWRSFYVVFVCKRPLALPATITGTINAGEESKDFTFTIESSKK